MHVVVNMVQQTPPRGKKHTRHRHKLFRRGKMFLDKHCLFSYLKLTSEYRWQVDCMPSGYQLDKVHDAHRKMMMRYHDFLATPCEYISARIKKPLDRLMLLVCALIWITTFCLLCVLVGIGRMISIVSRKK